jgi:subtilisin family serine protease
MTIWAVALLANATIVDFLARHPGAIEHLGVAVPGVVENVHLFRAATTRSLRSSNNNDMVEWADEQVPRTYAKRQDDDPLYNDQWHLHGPSPACVTADGAPPSLNGTGVTVAIVDDGLQHAHPELALNYDGPHSHNYNGGGNSDDPTPQSIHDAHGTAAAAVAVGRAHNGVCGRGVAPAARVVGLRLIAGPVADYTEALALSRFPSVVDIYSNSWGPVDDGRRLEGPGRLVRETLARMVGDGVGRRGKGSIYVWAAGNGRERGDSCNYDGYANNPYVNAIGAVDVTGAQAYYSEGCAALLAVAPSSGAMRGITTADLLGAAGYAPGNCTATFGGTSAAAPLAAGIFALLLQQRPSLTWRELKHAVARGATKINVDDPSWRADGAHSNRYGFGLLRIPRLLEAVAALPVLPAQRQVILPSVAVDGLVIGHDPTPLALPLAAGASALTFIEAVILTVSLTHPRRGQLTVTLTNPTTGTVSTLAEYHPADANADYPGWSFSSLRHWGERAGTLPWVLRVADYSGSGLGRIKWARLGFFGT